MVRTFGLTHIALAVQEAAHLLVESLVELGLVGGFQGRELEHGRVRRKGDA